MKLGEAARLLPFVVIGSSENLLSHIVDCICSDMDNSSSI